MQRIYSERVSDICTVFNLHGQVSEELLMLFLGLTKVITLFSGGGGGEKKKHELCNHRSIVA